MKLAIGGDSCERGGMVGGEVLKFFLHGTASNETT